MPHAQPATARRAPLPAQRHPETHETPNTHARTRGAEGSLPPVLITPRRDAGGGDGAQPSNSQGGQDAARAGPRRATLSDTHTLSEPVMGVGSEKRPHSQSAQDPYNRGSTRSPSRRHSEPVTPGVKGRGDRDSLPLSGCPGSPRARAHAELPSVTQRTSHSTE